MSMLFQDWYPLLRILIVGPLAYAGLVATLRVSGKRTLSKMNAFDFIVTVALGSTLATVVVSRTVPLLEGLLALGLLVFLQYIVAFASIRSDAFASIVKSQPRLLFFRGGFLAEAMRAERITRSEVIAAIRQQGISALSEVEAVVIETAGELSIVTRSAGTPPTALSYVRGVPEEQE